MALRGMSCRIRINENCCVETDRAAPTISVLSQSVYQTVAAIFLITHAISARQEIFTRSFSSAKETSSLSIPKISLRFSSSNDSSLTGITVGCLCQTPISLN